MPTTHIRSVRHNAVESSASMLMPVAERTLLAPSLLWAYHPLPSTSIVSVGMEVGHTIVKDITRTSLSYFSPLFFYFQKASLQSNSLIIGDATDRRD